MRNCAISGAIFRLCPVRQRDFGLTREGENSEDIPDTPKPHGCQSISGISLIPRFAELAKPPTQLTRKDQKCTWGPIQQEAFENLKERLCTAPVLAYPNFKLTFILTTNASKTALGAILSQVQDGAEKPLAYASRQTNTAVQGYYANELELLALAWAKKYFRC